MDAKNAGFVTTLYAIYDAIHLVVHVVINCNFIFYYCVQIIPIEKNEITAHYTILDWLFKFNARIQYSFISIYIYIIQHRQCLSKETETKKYRFIQLIMILFLTILLIVIITLIILYIIYFYFNDLLLRQYILGM